MDRKQLGKIGIGTSILLVPVSALGILGSLHLYMASGANTPDLSVMTQEERNERIKQIKQRAIVISAISVVVPVSLASGSIYLLRS